MVTGMLTPNHDDKVFMSLNSQFHSVKIYLDITTLWESQKHQFLQSLDYYVVITHMGWALYFRGLLLALYGVSVGQDYRANQGGLSGSN